MKALVLRRGLLAAGCFISLAASACLDLSPPPTEGTLQLPTITPTLIPTNTPLPEATITATSTATPTVTATSTATPAPFSPGVGGSGTTVVVSPPPNISQAPSTSLTPGPPGTTLPPILVNSPGSPGTATIGASTDWGCDGDERMEFVPPVPRAADKLFIFVTAAKERQFGLIIGPQLSGVQGANVQGGSGLKKQWELTPAKSGRYEYHFYGGPYPEHLCVSGMVDVGEAASAAPLVTPTATTTPTRTPTPLPPPRPDH